MPTRLYAWGEETDTETVMDEIRRNKGYFDHSGGGVTFSGGECMLQTEPLLELLKSCRKEGIHTAVDTAGKRAMVFPGRGAALDRSVFIRYQGV